MHRAVGIGGSIEEARSRALGALKDQLWRDCWREEIDLPDVRESVVEEDGVFEVTVEL